MNIFKRPWTLRSILTSLLLASLGSLAIVMIAIGIFGWQQITLSTASDTIKTNAQLTELRLNKIISPASTAIRILSGYVMTTDDLGPHYKYLPMLESELKSSELISAVYIGFENGDFIAVRALNNKLFDQGPDAPEGADYLLQVISHNQKDQAEKLFFYFKYGQELIDYGIATNFDLSPQNRPWFKAAIDNDKLNLSTPYAFYSTKQIGLTISKRTQNKNAVIGMDIALDDMSTVLEEVKITPHTELAIISNDGDLLGYKDIPKILDDWADKNFTNELLPEINILEKSPLIKAYTDSYDELNQFEFNNQKWLGITKQMGNNLSMKLVMAIPINELLGKAYKYMQLMLTISIIIILMAFILSRLAAKKISKYLDQLVNQAGDIVRFNFSKVPDKNIPIREIVDLQTASNKVSKTLDSMLSISKIIGTESDLDIMLQKVVELTVDATHCIAGAVYISAGDSYYMHKSAAHYSNNPAVGPNPLAANIDYYPEYINYDPINDNHPLCQTQNNNLSLEFELRDRNNKLQGLLILEFSQSQQQLYGIDFEAFVNKLTGMLEVAIETRQLIEAQKDLFYGMIHMLADAIDAKSPYTGGHCKRVPELAIMMVDSLQKQTEGKYKNFELSDNEIKEFAIAAWLHDSGKLVMPQDIVDKASKLEIIYNRIHEIRMRFEVLLRDAEIKYLHEVQSGVNQDKARKEYLITQQSLLDDFEFVANCNIGSEHLDDAAIDRLKQISAKTWLRNFDDMLGLSRDELKQRSKGRDINQTLPVTEQLLANKESDLIEWPKHDLIAQLNADHPGLDLDIDQPEFKQNTGELHNLTISKGTLTEEDRFIIKNHMVHTLLMLHKLPWPPGFTNIPDIASNHHERMDGTGYPRRLKAGDLPITHRVLAIADVFEALTASDRPYKQTKTLSETLHIMANMCLDQHLDTDLFINFLEHKTWQKYSNKFLKSSQIDEVDIKKIIYKLNGQSIKIN